MEFFENNLERFLVNFLDELNNKKSQDLSIRALNDNSTTYNRYTIEYHITNLRNIILLINDTLSEYRKIEDKTEDQTNTITNFEDIFKSCLEIYEDFAKILYNETDEKQNTDSIAVNNDIVIETKQMASFKQTIDAINKKLQIFFIVFNGLDLSIYSNKTTVSGQINFIKEAIKKKNKKLSKDLQFSENYAPIMNILNAFKNI
jgi:hypothetical protein